ncbi:hypothetical protein EV175_007130, partial [Coemansia sp. RSA 1933]
TVAKLVEATASTRERSKQLLSRCLQEIDVLMTSSASAVDVRKQSNTSSFLSLWRYPDATNGSESSLAQSIIESERLGDEPLAARFSGIAATATAASERKHQQRRMRGVPEPPTAVEAEALQPAAAAVEDSQPVIETAVSTADIDDSKKMLTVDEVDDNSSGDGSAGSEWAVARSFIGHMDTVRAVCVRSIDSSSKSQQLLTGADDGMLMLWDLDADDQRRRASASSRQRRHSQQQPQQWQRETGHGSADS